MKKNLTLILFLITSSIYPQFKGFIEYDLKIGNTKPKNHINDIVSKYTTIAGTGATKLTFVLQFVKDEAQFFLKDNLRNDDKDAKIAISFTDYDNIIYTNSKEKILLYNNRKEEIFKKEEFLVKDTLITSWKLINETKIIQNYICLKAITTISYKEQKKIFVKDIVAWYCPKFPFSFGPMGFGGLPGIIFELNVADVLYGARTISFKDNINLIEKPNKGKLISRDGYFNEIVSRRANYVKFIENK